MSDVDMRELVARAKSLLQSGAVKIVIGYGRGTGGKPRPLVLCESTQASLLIWTESPSNNIATYVTRREFKTQGRIAIVAPPPVLRSLLQLAAERQLADESVMALVAAEDGSVTELSTLTQIEEFLATAADAMRAEDRGSLERLSKMSVAERREFWARELERCVKCYACRASCPMCYCERCTMDVSRPQWVPAPSHALGNLEYHIVRAMHLAGRCVECGACGASCPVGIPVHLFSFFAEESVRRNFGQRGGASAKPDYALSTFKPDDKESFIR